MIAEQRISLPILLFVYLSLFSSTFALSQSFWDYLNSTTGLPNSWISMPSVKVLNMSSVKVFNSSKSPELTPILRSRKDITLFLLGFYCLRESTIEYFLSILLSRISSSGNLSYPAAPSSENQCNLATRP